MQDALPYVFLFAFVAFVFFVIVMKKKKRVPAAKADSGKKSKVEQEAASAQMAERENRIAGSLQRAREMLLRLVGTMDDVDTATDKSSTSLIDVRGSLDQMDIPESLSSAHSTLLSEIDHVLTTNAALRKELSESQKTLAVQKGEIEKLQTTSRIDFLTGLANRGHFDEALKDAVDRFKRYGEKFSLVMMDLDFFKTINDTYGHMAGDRVLVGFARKLRASLRGSDFVARFGGEEFAVIIVKADREKARVIAEAVRESVSMSKFKLDTNEVRVTVSAGIAQIDDGDNTKSILERADQELYRAKESGRDKVCVAG